MRTYAQDKTGKWLTITNESHVWFATLVQTLRLNEDESPFYSNYGIPARASIASQVAPNAAIFRTQQQYSPYFASVSVYRETGKLDPSYIINVILKDGSSLSYSFIA